MDVSKLKPTLLGPHVTPIDIDRDSPSFALNSQERTKWIKELVENRLSEGGDPETLSALSFLHSKILEPEALSEAQKEFWIDFIYWLHGKPRSLEDKTNTRWLIDNSIPEHHKNLTQFIPDVGKFT